MVAAAQASPGPTVRADSTMGVRLVDLEPGYGMLDIGTRGWWRAQSVGDWRRGNSRTPINIALV
eukprot:1869141-Alexandrium_andersonii.AAC.1